MLDREGIYYTRAGRTSPSTSVSGYELFMNSSDTVPTFFIRDTLMVVLALSNMGQAIGLLRSLSSDRALDEIDDGCLDEANHTA